MDFQLDSVRFKKIVNSLLYIYTVYYIIQYLYTVCLHCCFLLYKIYKINCYKTLNVSSIRMYEI